MNGSIVESSPSITRLSHPDLTLSVPLDVLTLTMFLISGNNQSRNPLLTPNAPQPRPRASWEPHISTWCTHQIVDTNRYPGNENILLLRTLTLAYMDLHLYPHWDRRLPCSENVWVGANSCECPHLLTGALKFQLGDYCYHSQWRVCLWQ